ncbi:MAG: transcriptional regulator, TetR family [Nitrobacter vulgaris]|jgi:AcrR family transcriptional regulator|nr:transcriptional regulator, TetR family [Nitrobacter vulgaris]
MKTAKPKRRNAATANSAKGRSATSRAGAISTQTGRAAKPPNRAARAAQRRAAIIAAGLDEFTARGFAATRLDDVAKRAGVAKGTIYLHFKDKEALFQELVRTALVPLIGNLMTVPAAGGSVREILERFAETFVRDVAGTKRGDIVRLIMAEGTRFPSLADFYFREVVSRGLAGMRKLIEYGIERGEIRNARLADFPQIVIAPAMVAVMWQGLFGRHAPLDAVAMLKVHLDLIFGERRAS